MSNILIDSKKTVLVASDIFGLSAAFLSLLEDTYIAEHAITVSPYQQSQTGFKNEQQAYLSFQNSGGIDAYILRLTDILKSYPSIIKVIGFSAGAAAIYKMMSNLPQNNIQLTLFYPGQIRHFLDKHPSCPCHIIFPKSESHFSLPDVIKVLKKQTHLKVEQNIYQHGFMNKNSKGFEQTAYTHYCQVLRELIAT